MQKFSLGSDNHSGIHPQILAAWTQVNVGHCAAYGTDAWTEETTKFLKTQFGESSESFFVFNGTAANVLCLRALIESFDAVITSSVSHLHKDECAAPENAVGCKLLLAESPDGKITSMQIEKHLERLGDQHCAQPRLVSITLPTEYGTCYSFDELLALRECIKKNRLLWHIDGSRMIYAAHFLKKSFKELTEELGVDAVSFGGTKNGLPFGELVILYQPDAIKKFKYIRKQNMQLPSKMRFLAAAFQTFLQPQGLWREIASHTHDLARYLADGLRAFPVVEITQKVEANSVFVKIPREWIKPLRNEFFFYVWDENTFELRWMLSFDLKREHIDQFLGKIKTLSRGATE